MPGKSEHFARDWAMQQAHYRRYVAANGQVLRVHGNNVLVRVDPETKTSRGGVIIPDNVLGGVYRTGKVVAIGALTGDRLEHVITVPGLGVGQHVLFVRFHEKAGANPQIQNHIDADLLCIRPADILLVMDAEDVNRVG